MLGSSRTLSVKAPLHAQLIQATQETLRDSLFVRDFKEAFHQDLLKRYTPDEEKATLNLASALDPRLKVLLFQSNEEKQETLERLVTEAAAAATTEHHDQEEAERLDQKHLSDGAPLKDESPVQRLNYSATLLKIAGRHYDQRSQLLTAPLPLFESPLDWWKEHHHEYLSCKADKEVGYLRVPGTSISTECVFSTAGDIVTAQRSSLTAEHVDQLLLCRNN
ncbi:uncharacterized protein LOC115372448 [Myripristis murdjan]|uniref:uncharacterized protein LOC115372448 n=1 Tax=Myripristis murdjan TaxID=586833 RepID=UPI00117639A4|nr:uncharacterized protein LOC115372448 [Myripristis murdjan]